MRKETLGYWLCFLVALTWAACSETQTAEQWRWSETDGSQTLRDSARGSEREIPPTRAGDPSEGRDREVIKEQPDTFAWRHAAAL